MFAHSLAKQTKQMNKGLSFNPKKHKWDRRNRSESYILVPASPEVGADANYGKLKWNPPMPPTPKRKLNFSQVFFMQIQQFNLQVLMKRLAVKAKGIMESRTEAQLKLMATVETHGVDEIAVEVNEKPMLKNKRTPPKPKPYETEAKDKTAKKKSAAKPTVKKAAPLKPAVKKSSPKKSGGK